VVKTALMEHKNSLYFVQEGDGLDDAQIVSVSPDSVIIKNIIKKKILKVN